MRLISSLFQGEVNIGHEEAFNLVIENKSVFYNFITDLYHQTQGQEGNTIISIDDQIVKTSKIVELITTIIPFEINEKRLITKINAILEKEALNEDNYQETMNLLGNIERYIDNLSDVVSVNIDCTGINAGSLVKMCGIEIVDDSECLVEKIFNYMNIVRELLGERLFVFVNLRSYVDDEELQKFIDTSIAHNIMVLLVDNYEGNKLKGLRKLIVDKDLCII